MKINNFLVGLVIIGVIILVIFSAYDIFLKPPDIAPAQNITPIDTYYGADVLKAIQTN